MVYNLEQKLEDQYKSRVSAMEAKNIKKYSKILEKKDSRLASSTKKIDKLYSNIERYKKDIVALKKTNKSALEEINKFKNLCKQLKDIIDIKDQKIISIDKKIISYSKDSTANPQGYSDGTIEPETFYSTYDNEKWNNLRYSAEYNPEIRKKYTFQNKS